MAPRRPEEWTESDAVRRSRSISEPYGPWAAASTATPRELRSPCEPLGREHALAREAATHADVLTLGELEALGLSARSVQHRATTGRLHRVARGIYTPGSPLLATEGLWRAALLAAGAGSALSHRTAAGIGRVMRTPGPVEVTTPGRPRAEIDGVTIYGRRTLDPRDIVSRRGLPVTSIPRTFVDLAAVLTQSQLEAAFDDAQARGLVSLRALDACLLRAGRRKGTRALRRLAAEATGGVTRSKLERAFRTMVAPGTVVRPQRNVHMRVGGLWIEADVVWPDERVIVELDGRDVHTRRRAFHDDRDRDFVLSAAGWNVVRLTWRHCTKEASRTLRRLEGLLATRAAARIGR